LSSAFPHFFVFTQKNLPKTAGFRFIFPNSKDKSVAGRVKRFLILPYPLINARRCALHCISVIFLFEKRTRGYVCDFNHGKESE
jgi:hypothetical protein